MDIILIVPLLLITLIATLGWYIHVEHHAADTLARKERWVSQPHFTVLPPRPVFHHDTAPTATTQVLTQDLTALFAELDTLLETTPHGQLSRSE